MSRSISLRVRSLATAAALTCLLAVPAGAAELHDPLPAVLDEAAPGALVPVYLVLERQVDRAEVRELRDAWSDRDLRRRAIAGRLKAVARSGQQPVLDWIAPEAAAGRVANVRPLWLTSVIGLEATPDVVRRLAEVEGIAAIRHNPERDVFLARESADRLDLDGDTAGGGIGADATITEIECGVDVMRAPQVWSEMGIDGEGAVVAVIDSGVCYTHPDIAQRIWVNPGEDLDGDGVVMDPDDMNGVDDDGNGHVDDLIGWNFEFGNNDPDDNNSHGSHCAGTVAGDGASGTQAGMAPGAEIMVVRVGLSTSDEVDVWNAMQYAAENGADAISMSLGWQHSWNPARETWRNNSENTIDMGTAMVVAAGNEGSGNAPDNVRTPGDVPRVITVGATDCSDQAASFSSRGPVTWQDVPAFGDHPYPPGLIKPEVSAPGVSTKSHNFCSGYSFKSGTSMATPHVAGAVALMVSANPSLSPDEIKQALMDTAVDLGDPGMDNTYGTGRVDAYEAVQLIAAALRYNAHVVEETDPDHGNGDGHVDHGEIATIRVTLENASAETVTGVRARLTSEDPDVEILNATSYWPDIPAGGFAESSGSHFTVRFPTGCGENPSFRLEMFADGHDPSFGSFRVRIGDRQLATFFEDDLEQDGGWTVQGSETDNPFVREDPNGVSQDGVDIQPEDDTTTTGTTCWVTGNPRTNGKFNPGDGDVDGTTELISPVFDATAGDELTLDFSRWVHISSLNFGETTHYAMEVSSDGGANWVEVQRLGTHDGAWEALSVPILAAATGDMRLKFRAAQEGGFGFGDTLVEVAIDDLRVHGVRYFCDEFVPPAAQAPNGIGATLTARREGPDGTRFDWQPSVVDATHDAATLYHVHRSASPDAGFAQAHETTEEFLVEYDDQNGTALSFYVVTASNGGGSSGDEPAP